MKQQALTWKFFKRVIIYSAPILLLAISLEVLQHLLPNNYTHKKNLLEQNLNELKVLILGSSHAYLGINPALLREKAFNLSSTAQTLYYDKFLLEKYIDRMPTLSKVVLSISYPSLGSESYKNPGDFNMSYYYAYFYGSNAFINRFAPCRYSLVSLFTVKKSVDRSWDYLINGDSLIEFDRNGWYITDEQRDLERNGRDAGNFHNIYYDDSLVPTNLGYLSAMIQLCKKRGVEVYLVSMPMWETYMAHIQESRYKKMVTLADSLSSTEGVPYFNFTEDRRFEGEDFFDSNHLRRQGAEKFTPILDSLIYWGNPEGRPVIPN